MKILICCLGLLSTFALSAQPIPVTIPVKEVKEPSTLMEQYQKLKATSETYAEYKVIKQNLLDKTWQTAIDSIKANRVALRQANVEISRLENELAASLKQFTEKEESVSSLEFDGTHISFLGIAFGKKTFISIGLIILFSLIALSGMLTIQMKTMYRYQRERTDVMDTLSREFEEYKRKTLEKQTKLSRELQNERNRVAETRKNDTGMAGVGKRPVS